MGDIAALYTADGTLIGTYEYDPYGKIIRVNATAADTDHLTEKNPFRYRGYYYDSETGWYYLNSRYYDPQVKRFISADSPKYLGVGDDINSYNLYAYSYDSPTNYTDNTGNLPVMESVSTIGKIFDVIFKNYTVTVGITVSGGLGIGGCGGGQIAYSNNGEVAFQSYLGGGVTSGSKLSVSLNVGIYPTMESVSDLEGEFVLVGGSYACGIGAGVDMVTAGADNDFDIVGLNISFMGGCGAEAHTWITNTW